MKSLMNKICIIIVAVLVSSGYPTVVLGADGEFLLSTGEAGVLEMLGIITNTEEYDEEITRGELAYMAAKLCNADISSGAGQKLFYDVPAEHKYYSYIYAMVELGIISGDGDGYFRPDDNASYAEACKIFSIVLGYKEIGYYKTYPATANQAGITSGVPTDEVLTKGHAAKMAYNTLHLGMYEAVQYGETMSYKVNEDLLAIERYHHLLMQKGIVTSAYGTTLTHPDDTCAENEIGIHDRIYTYPNNADLLGKAVVYYIDSGDQDAKEIKYLYEDEGKNKVLTIDSSDIASFGNGIFKYYKGSTTASVSFDGKTDVIYNGVAHPNYADSDFCPEMGKVTFIDNNKDGHYDVALIQSYKFMVVKSVDADNQVIYGKYPEVKIGSADNDNINMRLFRGDSKALISAVRENSVLAVKESKNTTGNLLIDIEILQLGAQGSVTALNDDFIFVDDVKYDMASNAVYDEAVKVGDTVSVYLFLDNCAVVLHSDHGDYKTGYLVSAGEKGGSLSSRLMVKMVDANRKMNVFECAEKIKIDEATIKDVNTALNLLQDSASQTNVNPMWPYSQLIKYRLDENGILTHIDTNRYDSSKETENSLKLDTSGRLQHYSVNKGFYETGEDGKFVASSPNAADIWIIPTDQRDQEEWYGTGIGRAIYNIEAYNIDSDSMVAGTVLVYINTINQVSNNAIPLVVSEVSDVVNEEGDVVRQIQAVGPSANTLTYQLADSLRDDSLAVGDMIRIRTNYANKIEFIEKWYACGETIGEVERIKTGADATDLSTLESSVRFAYGTVLSTKDGFITHTTSVPTDFGGIEAKAGLNNYLVLSGTRFYVYDLTARNPEVRAGTIEDIITFDSNPENPDQVFVITQTGNLRFVYIVRG